jgi:macrolide transport system ATP-binding/permease protein
VTAAAFALYSPMSGDNWSSRLTIEGHGTTDRLLASWNRVTPGFFETVGTPLLRGRDFNERDRSGAPVVAIVNQTFAKQFFGDTDPIGRRFGFSDSAGKGKRDIEIVGVVGDAKHQDARRPAYPTFFLRLLQPTPDQSSGAAAVVHRSHYAQALLIRTAAGATPPEGQIRHTLAGIDRRLIVRTLRPMEEQVAGNFNLERLIARLTFSFGGVALLLACLGIYGVTAHAVTRRTREIGIRMAIGASRAEVLRTVLRGAFVQLALGVGLGLPAVFVAGKLLQTHLFGVSGRDPVILGAGVAILSAAAVFAALIPARRAAAMNPVTALRLE